MRKNLHSIDYYVDGIQVGDRIVLSQAITLVESTKTEHRQLANDLIGKILPTITTSSMRLGITGVPGAGKSSFIERFGLFAIEKGRQVAVLAVDPSSSKSKGSILGDKTRMEGLGNHPKAYIRPSAAGESLGGVAQKTRETVLLCEAAGFDTIIIETVGVGQSEVAVSEMVDFFMLLVLTGAGDELQGMKRGIMEMADLIAVNKADGTNLESAKRTVVEYNRALSLFPKRANGWKPSSLAISAQTDLGIEKVWKKVITFFEQDQEGIEERRALQNIAWMHDTIRTRLLDKLYGNPENRKEIVQLEQAVRQNQLSSYQAALKAIQLLG